MYNCIYWIAELQRLIDVFCVYFSFLFLFGCLFLFLFEVYWRQFSRSGNVCPQNIKTKIELKPTLTDTTDGLRIRKTERNTLYHTHHSNWVIDKIMRLIDKYHSYIWFDSAIPLEKEAKKPTNKKKKSNKWTNQAHFYERLSKFTNTQSSIVIKWRWQQVNV